MKGYCPRTWKNKLERARMFHQSWITPNAENTLLPPLIPSPLEKYDSIHEVIQSSDVANNFPSLMSCSHEKCNSIPKATQILHAINVQPELDNNEEQKDDVLVYTTEVLSFPNTFDIDEITGPMDKKQEIFDNRKKMILEGGINDTDFDAILDVYTKIIDYYSEELEILDKEKWKVKCACEMFENEKRHISKNFLRKWNFPVPSNNKDELEIHTECMIHYYWFLVYFFIVPTIKKLHFAKKCFHEIESLRKSKNNFDVNHELVKLGYI